MDAKQYEKIGKRSAISRVDPGADATEHAEIILDDAFNEVEKAVEKDGTSGFLSNPDGILRGKPQLYKGFFIQCFGMVRYQNDLDIYGRLYWYGTAKRKIMIKGKEQGIEFSTENFLPLGFDSERDCGNWLFCMVDKFQTQLNR